jgi:hypothetical protein
VPRIGTNLIGLEKSHLGLPTIHFVHHVLEAGQLASPIERVWDVLNN